MPATITRLVTAEELFEMVYHAGEKPARYGDRDELRDERTLPGFTLKIGDLFDGQ
jgi:hypothetical protein